MRSEFDESKLIQAARDAAGSAYAPYSNYPVGAAVLAEDGRIFTGCNVENISYGLTMCAERVAVFKARNENCSRFRAIAVYAPRSTCPMPCGACRQVLAEGGNNPIVIVACADSKPLKFKLEDLLPYPFQF